MASHFTPGPTEVFEQALPGIQVGDVSDLMSRCTEDVVFEFPFAPAGRPRRVQGRDAVLEYLKPLSSRVRMQGLSRLEMHQTADPDVAVIEFTANALVAGDGESLPISYVVVLTVRDGQIARYRDYWNPLALAAGDTGR